MFLEIYPFGKAYFVKALDLPSFSFSVVQGTSS